MYAFRVRCEHLAGSSLAEQDQLIQFDSEGVSGPLPEALAAYLTDIPGFVVHDTMEIDDPVEEEPVEETEDLVTAGDLPPTVEDGALPPAEESAFIRWFNANAAEERARFVQEESLRRDELLRVMKEETREGAGHPKVLAAVAAALFRLRSRFFGRPA